MERDQEKMQFLGLFGIFKESYMIMLSCRKIFSLISLTLNPSLSLTSLFHMNLSLFILGCISYHTKHQWHFDTMTITFIILILFKPAYLFSIIFFSLISTSDVVYTIASIYAGSEVALDKTISIPRNVWKKLMIPFSATFIYNIAAELVVITWVVTVREKDYGTAIFVVIGVLYWVGFLYLATVSQLANVVCMLEDSYGLKAMMKSKELIKGKKGLSMIITFMLSVSSFLIHYLFSMAVVSEILFQLGLVWRIALGVLCVFLLSHLFLLMLVTQTVLYFVCKSYHHEIIDKSALSKQLEVLCQGVLYQPLKANDVKQDNNV